MGKGFLKRFSVNKMTFQYILRAYGFKKHFWRTSNVKLWYQLQTYQTSNQLAAEVLTELFFTYSLFVSPQFVEWPQDRLEKWVRRDGRWVKDILSCFTGEIGDMEVEFRIITKYKIIFCHPTGKCFPHYSINRLSNILLDGRRNIMITVRSPSK